MAMTLAEMILILAAVFGIYRLLGPLQRRLEDWIRGLLDPGRRNIIDVEPCEVKKEKPFKE